MKYSVNWLTASASGLGAYHLSILFTRMLQPSAAVVGYYSVALSLLTPLYLLPTSVSMVLFPRITGNYARGEDNVNADLIKKATVNLLLPLGICTVVLCGLSTDILGSMTIPTTRANILAFQLVAGGLTIALLSTPAGSFLSATAYAGTSSIIGVSTLALGVVLWMWTVPHWGIVGTAAGYAALMCARGVANILISNRRGQWLPASSGRGCALAFLVLASPGIAYSTWGIDTRLALVAVISVAVMLLFAREVADITKAMVRQFPSRRAHP
jgi:O-antigen/teichoic acid export membrane protein